MNIDDFLTHVSRVEDLAYLKTKLFDVNIRLFNSSEPYRKLVLQACEVISQYSLTEFDGYKLPHGMSGANAGIPWNIIAIVKNRGTKEASSLVMINPRLLRAGKYKIPTKTNCGSIRLESPITVCRFEYVTVEYFDINGEKVIEQFDSKTGGFTIQHEIDHNLGILITDWNRQC